MITLNVWAIAVPVFVGLLVASKLIIYFKNTENKVIKILIFIMPLFIACPVIGYFFGS